MLTKSIKILDNWPMESEVALYALSAVLTGALLGVGWVARAVLRHFKPDEPTLFDR